MLYKVPSWDNLILYEVMTERRRLRMHVYTIVYKAPWWVQKWSTLTVALIFFAGFLAISCSSFYSATRHEETQDSAAKLLELIADGNVSNIGENDEEDATCELTESCVAAEHTDIVEDEDAVGEEAQTLGEMEDSAVSKTVRWQKKISHRHWILRSLEKGPSPKRKGTL